MIVSQELVPVLKKLRLSGVLQSLDLRTKEAVDGNLAHEEFLFRLCQDEVHRRDGKQLEMRMRRAAFESVKGLDDFDFQFNPEIPKAKLIELGTCNFIELKRNVLLIGPAGVGKSHVAQAIGARACRAGFSVLYISAHRMLSQMRASRADQTYDKKLLRFTVPDLLIVDDVGLRPLQDDEPIDLYEVIRQRYEHGSMIVTSNRDLEEWTPLFLDALIASAAMDRLLHDAQVVHMKGDSFRNPPENRKRRKR